MQIILFLYDSFALGYLSEDMFVAWVQTLPQETVQSILNFPIIPPNLTLSKSWISYPSVSRNVYLFLFFHDLSFTIHDFFWEKGLFSI